MNKLFSDKPEAIENAINIAKRCSFILKEKEPKLPKVFTDIDKDGVLEGVSFDQLNELLQSTTLKIIASGGVSSLDDIKKIREIGIHNKNLDGVIVGKAIYENMIAVNKAIKILKERD